PTIALRGDARKIPASNPARPPDRGPDGARGRKPDASKPGKAIPKQPRLGASAVGPPPARRSSAWCEIGRVRWKLSPSLFQCDPPNLRARAFVSISEIRVSVSGCVLARRCRVSFHCTRKSMDLTRTAYGTWSGGRYMHFGQPLPEDRFHQVIQHA